MSFVTERTGDIFAAEPGSILIHACNCRGSWGAGIAAAFKARYPQAFRVYKEHCDHNRNPRDLVGSCLLIPPQYGDHDKDPENVHWIACLFTSDQYGRRRDGPEAILDATEKSIEDLLSQLKRVRDGDSQGKDKATDEEFGMLVSCRINSQRFGVPWKRTEDVMESVLSKWNNEVKGEEWKLEVVERPGV
ncbi:MAG: ADP-ribose 1''-phosphate phosphatase [Piccolia ochrophora]|nr:MAG: ADP-ribose 1''-phosphate phosphatase [Piccolia ochrophora]